MEKANLGYKIRNKKTGLYSTGGHAYEDKNFNKVGKTWKNLGHVKSHLGMYDSNRITDWEVVTFALVEVDKYDVSALLALKK